MSGATRSAPPSAGSSALATLTDVDAPTREDRRVAVWRGDTTSGKMAFRDPGGFWIDDFVPTGGTLDRTGTTGGSPAGTNRAALQAAYLAAVAASGGTVRLGSGILRFDGVSGETHALYLQPGHAGLVTIEGEGRLATTHRQSATTWGFARVDPLVVTAGTVQKVRLHNFGIDHQSNANTYAGGALLDITGQFSIDQITVEDIEVVNMGAPLATGNNRIINILPTTQAGVLNGSTRYTVDRIFIRRVRAIVGGGGNTGILIGGYVNDPANQKIPSGYYKTPLVANVIVGRCEVDDVEWDSGANPTVFRACSGIQFGGDALCPGPTRVRRSSFTRSWDVNGEFDSCLDLTVEDCVFSDAWSEDIFVTTWGGGGNTTDGLLEQGVNRFVRTKVRRTANGATATAANLGFGVAVASKGGILPPSVEFEDFTVERVGPEGTKQGGIPIFIDAAPRRITLKNFVVSDQAPTDSISTSQTNRILAVIQAIGGKTHLLVDGFHWERPDDQVNATAVNAIRVWWGLNIAAGSDLTYDIKNVTQRFNVAAYTGSASPSVKVRAVSGSLTSGANGSQAAQLGVLSEPFTTAGVLAGNFDLVAGTGFTQTGGVVAVPAGYGVTTESLHRWIAEPNLIYYDDLIGKAVDATLQFEFTMGAALASGGVGVLNEVVVKEVDSQNKLIACVGADTTGANPFLRWDKVINGARTTIQTQALSAGVLAAATKLTLRAAIRGNVATADCFAGTNTTLGTTATDHLAVTLDTATAAVLGESVLGWSGFGGIPADAAWNVDNAKYWRCSVLRGVHHAIHPKRAGNVAEAFGLDLEWTALQYRIAGECALERSSFAGLAGATTIQELRVTDAALAPLVRARANGTAAAWNPAITPGASPYTYTNNDVTDEIVTITGGTVSSVQVSRDGGTTFVTIASATGTEVRLRHGDQLKVTYTVAPTMTKVRA